MPRSHRMRRCTLANVAHATNGAMGVFTQDASEIKGFGSKQILCVLCEMGLRAVGETGPFLLHLFSQKKVKMFQCLFFCSIHVLHTLYKHCNVTNHPFSFSWDSMQTTPCQQSTSPQKNPKHTPGLCLPPFVTFRCTIKLVCFSEKSTLFW